jgi:thermitase
MMSNRKVQSIFALVLILAVMAGAFWPAIAQGTRAQDIDAGGGSFSSLSQASGAPEEIEAGEILVKFKSGASTSSVDGALWQQRSFKKKTLYGTDVQLWEVPDGEELALVEQLNADPAVEYAEPNYVYHAIGAELAAEEVTPNDPYYGNQWALTIVQSPGAWKFTTGSADVIIAILDTGVDQGHPDLASKLVDGYDFVDDDDDPSDANGHGTHVSGIAAAATNNATGIAGMSWNTRIMPVRVLNSQGNGTNADITSGIYWAFEHGARILSMSLGGSTYSQAMQDAVTAAHAAGGLVIASMGNCRQTGPGCPQANPTNFPAAYANVMAVAATGPTDAIAPYSQYGDHCDISAPGGSMTRLHDPKGIYSTMPTYPVYMNTAFGYYMNYDYVHGTSQATPYVAGLAALIWATDLTRTPDQVRKIIEDTATDLGPEGWDPDYGYGRINAQAALQAVAPPLPPEAPALLPIQNADGDGSYVVDWDPVSDATSYTVQEDADAAFSSPASFSTGSNTQYAVSGKPPSTTWYYRVSAHNAGGDSPWSNVASATVAPAAPTLYPIDNGTNEDAYLITWSAVAEALGYTLAESDNPSCSPATIRYVGPALQYNVTGQPAGTWTYCVRAANVGGDSPWSNFESVTVASGGLTAPELYQIDDPGDSQQYDIAWSEVSGATAYTLEESRDPYFASPMVVYSDTLASYTAMDQASGTWSYRVRAFGPGSKSPWSNVESVSVLSYFFLPYVARNPVPVPSETWQTIMNEKFEGTFPTTGWEVSGDYQWAKRDCRPYRGSFSAWAVGATLNGPRLDCDSYYPDGVNSWMVFGPFSLEGASDAQLTFQAWVNVASGDDQLCHMVSLDDLNFSGFCTTSSFPQETWTDEVFELTDVRDFNVIGEPAVWLALGFASDSINNAPEGAYVDNLVLRKYVGSTSAGAEEGAATLPPADWYEPAAFILNR